MIITHIHVGQDTTYAKLGEIAHYEDIEDKNGNIIEGVLSTSKRMSWGELRNMRDWTEEQGPTDPPWRIRKIVVPGLKWQIPLPVFALVAMFAFLVATTIGLLSIRSTVLIGTFVVVLLAFLGIFVSEYKFHKRGYCHMCGKASSRDEPLKHNNIKVVDYKGKEKEHSKAGMCHSCHDNLVRFQMWDTALLGRWDLIKKHKVGGLFFPRYKDPLAPAATTSVLYTRADFRHPQDNMDDHILANLEDMFLKGADTVRSLRKKKRLIT